MAPYMNEYYRARIKELSGDTVSVIFVDYGNSEEMSIGQVRQLLPEFRALENQVSVRSNQVSVRSNQVSERSNQVSVRSNQVSER